MGVIKRQGLKNSLVNYAGVLLGVVNVLFIYTHSFEQYGMVQWFLSTSLLLMPFILMGMNAVVIKFFPVFQDAEQQHNGFLGMLLIGATIGIVLFVLAFVLLAPHIITLYEDKPLIYQAFFWLMPLVCLRGVIELLTQYVSNFQRIVIPAVLNQLIKVTLPILIILFLFEKITSLQIMYGVVANYVIVLFFLIIYIKKIGQFYVRPQFHFIQKPLWKEMKTYAGYGILGLLGTHLALRIDTVMVGTLIGELTTGHYGVVLLIASVIEIPTFALMKITGPIVASAWKKQDLKHIEELYKKSSLNLLIVGVFIFIGIWSCLDNLFELLENGEELYVVKNVVLFIGLAKLIDMLTSINNQIIGYSEYFRFNFYAILAMAVFNIITNLIFIPIYGGNGAAMATLASLSLYNLLKFSYVKYRFKMMPFSWNTLWVIVLGIAVYALTFLVPDTAYPLLDILIKGSFITIIFGGLTLLFKLSPDLNELAMTGLQNALNFLKKKQ